MQEQSRISEPKSEEEPLQESFHEKENPQPESPSLDKDRKEENEPTAITEQSREENFIRAVPRSGGLSPFTAAHVEAASPAKWQTRSQNCVTGGEGITTSPPQFAGVSPLAVSTRKSAGPESQGNQTVAGAVAEENSRLGDTTMLSKRSPTSRRADTAGEVKENRVEENEFAAERREAFSEGKSESECEEEEEGEEEEEEEEEEEVAKP